MRAGADALMKGREGEGVIMGKIFSSSHVSEHADQLQAKKVFSLKKTSTNLCKRLRRRQFYSNIVKILSYCINIVIFIYIYSRGGNIGNPHMYHRYIHMLGPPVFTKISF